MLDHVYFEKSWRHIPLMLGLTPEEILRHTIYRPDAPEVQDLASYLDAGCYQGILCKFAGSLIEQVKPLIANCMSLTPTDLAALNNPKTFFQVENQQQARERLVAHFRNRVAHVPKPVTMAVSAWIEFGLGQCLKSILCASYALYEKEEQDFETLIDQDHPAAINAWIKTETKKAEILIRHIEDFRRSPLTKRPHHSPGVFYF